MNNSIINEHFVYNFYLFTVDLGAWVFSNFPYIWDLDSRLHGRNRKKSGQVLKINMEKACRLKSYNYD